MPSERRKIVAAMRYARTQGWTRSHMFSDREGSMWFLRGMYRVWFDHATSDPGLFVVRIEDRVAREVLIDYFMPRSVDEFLNVVYALGMVDDPDAEA